MCICINCRHIHRCKTYEFIEKQHKDNKIKYISNYFIPMNTIIIVNINKKYLNIYLDWDLQECSSFIEKPGNWLTF
uniref:hypothetical protein Ycf34 n=1 Tax=Lophurella stichidiosa TaxID=2008659 RepID=UPI002551EAEF|nr:hypothetical protein Ycf34 [Aphanocladia stichidiosa]WGH14050.1 hypothetical protein Ycf34 [Aphanocladia stichidiosa]